MKIKLNIKTFKEKKFLTNLSTVSNFSNIFFHHHHQI